MTTEHATSIDGMAWTWQGTALAAPRAAGTPAVGAAPLLQSPHPPHGLRYADVVALPDGGTRWFYEATRADGAHELRTVLLPA